jgi:hypothetical protein
LTPFSSILKLKNDINSCIMQDRFFKSLLITYVRSGRCLLHSHVVPAQIWRAMPCIRGITRHHGLWAHKWLPRDDDLYMRCFRRPGQQWMISSFSVVYVPSKYMDWYRSYRTRQHVSQGPVAGQDMQFCCVLAHVCHKCVCACHYCHIYESLPWTWLDSSSMAFISWWEEMLLSGALTFGIASICRYAVFFFSERLFSCLFCQTSFYRRGAGASGIPCAQVWTLKADR